MGVVSFFMQVLPHRSLPGPDRIHMVRDIIQYDQLREQLDLMLSVSHQAGSLIRGWRSENKGRLFLHNLLSYVFFQLVFIIFFQESGGAFLC